jgi:uncharacterized heparinase superfamily protein
VRAGMTNESVAFTHTGLCVSRLGNMYLAVDCGDVGLRGRGGHGHHDTLSFEFSVGGQDVIVDTGGSRYTASARERISVLGPHAHNVLVVETMPGPPLKLGDIACCSSISATLEQWHAEPERTQFVGSHSAYGTPKNPITWRRCISHEMSPPSVVTTDRVSGEGRHEVAIYFHLAPEITATISAPGCVRLALPNCRPSWLFAAPNGSDCRLVRGVVYPTYASSIEADVIVVRSPAQLPASFTCTISEIAERDV